MSISVHRSLVCPGLIRDLRQALPHSRIRNVFTMDLAEDRLILLELERRRHFRHEAARSYGRRVSPTIEIARGSPLVQVGRGRSERVGDSPLSKKNARKIAQILERGGHLVACNESTHVKSRWGDAFPSDESKTQFRTPPHLRKPHYSGG
jgi:hypothetical protein